MILEMNLKDCDETGCVFTCLLQSGSKANLKPEILVEAFGKYADVNIVRTIITREDVFVEKDGELVDLLQYRD